MRKTIDEFVIGLILIYQPEFSDGKDSDMTPVRMFSMVLELNRKRRVISRFRFRAFFCTPAHV
jgi:hypothetical protein